jgi:hypothetical protein
MVVLACRWSQYRAGMRRPRPARADIRGPAC